MLVSIRVMRKERIHQIFRTIKFQRPNDKLAINFLQNKTFGLTSINKPIQPPTRIGLNSPKTWYPHFRIFTTRKRLKLHKEIIQFVIRANNKRFKRKI